MDGPTMWIVFAVVAILAIIIAWVKTGFSFKKRFLFWIAGNQQPAFKSVYKKANARMTDSYGRTLLFKSILYKAKEQVKWYLSLPNPTFQSELECTVNEGGTEYKRKKTRGMLEFAVMTQAPDEMIFILTEHTSSLDDLHAAREVLYEHALPYGACGPLNEGDRSRLGRIEHRIYQLQGQEIGVESEQSEAPGNVREFHRSNQRVL